MHELAITEGIMEAALPAAEQAGASKILEIRLKIGELSGVIPDCIREYFSIISKGTIAEGAVITVERIPITAECRDCGGVSTLSRSKICCSHCGGSNIKLLTGREYYVDSLEVDA